MPPAANGCPAARRRAARRQHARRAGNAGIDRRRGRPSGGYFSSANASGQPTVENPFAFSEEWNWQVLPDSIIYKSYLAGNREPRFGSQLVHINNMGWMWDVTLGGRAGIIRYGTTDPYWPEGFQLDLEGAAFPRMNLEHDRDVDDIDFRFGVPFTWRRGSWEAKVGYYHLSSHLGDEYMVRNATLDRLNYVRDCLQFGLGLFLNPNFRLYSEVDYAFYTDGGAQPWEFQFGAEYSPIDKPTVPRFAVHRRQRAPAPGGEFRRQREFPDRLAMARPHRPSAPHRHPVLQRHERTGPVL